MNRQSTFTDADLEAANKMRAKCAKLSKRMVTAKQKVKAKPQAVVAKMRMRQDRKRPTKTIKYHEYMKSAAWRQKRVDAFKFYGKKCSECESVHRLQIHHRTYKRLGNEAMKDLRVLCYDCHTAKHDRKSGIRRDPLEREYQAIMGNC